MSVSLSLWLPSSLSPPLSMSLWLFRSLSLSTDSLSRSYSSLSHTLFYFALVLLFSLAASPKSFLSLVFPFFLPFLPPCLSYIHHTSNCFFLAFPFFSPSFATPTILLCSITCFNLFFLMSFHSLSPSFSLPFFNLSLAQPFHSRLSIFFCPSPSFI